MTTTLPRGPAETISPDQGLRVTQLRVVRSEWTKFRSLRSTHYTLLLSVVFMIGLGAIFTAIQAHQAQGFDPGQTAISASLTGTFFAELVFDSGDPRAPYKFTTQVHIVPDVLPHSFEDFHKTIK